MPGSVFTRRGSNAPTVSSQMARSSSSTNPGLPPSQNHPVLSPGGGVAGTMSSSLGTSNPLRHFGAASPGLNGSQSSTNCDMSEFGVGPYFNATATMGRGYEANSANTSPSQSPSLNGGPSTFSSAFSSTLRSNIVQGSQSSQTDGTYTTSNLSSNTLSFISPHQNENLLREIFSRRVACLNYIKKCLSIASLPSSSQAYNIYLTPAWLDIIKITKRDLEAIYDTDKMKRRTLRNFVLGCSLAPILDYNSSTECAKNLLLIFQEVETMSESGDRDKAKMKSFFKSSLRGTRRGTVSSDWETGLGGACNHTSAASMNGIDLLTNHVPFPLDFFQTTITLLDVLMEIYHKLTYFSLQTTEAGNVSTVSLTKDNDTSIAGEATTSPFSASTLDTINKIDMKVKKFMSQICKELDSVARHVIREELAAIDPMMARELGVLEGNGSGDTSFHHLSES